MNDTPTPRIVLYRMGERAGKKSSPLDAICSERWPPRTTDGLLEFLGHSR